MMKLVFAPFVMVAAQVEDQSGGMPLDVATLDGGARLTVTVTASDPSGTALPPQKLLLDTGSSTLAFCDSTFQQQLQSYALDKYSCNAYGSGSSPSSGYWGPFYSGPISIGASSGNPINIDEAYYSVMHQQEAMPCTDGFNGIFGIAFKQLDMATSEQPNWPADGVGSCPRPTQDFVQPLMSFLNSEGGVKQLGLFWSGKQGEGEGVLYLDGDAVKNAHYDADKAAAIGKASLGEFGWYDIDVVSVDYNGQSVTDSVCNPEQGSPCIMDTGTPVLLLPEEIYDAMYETQSGSVSVKLAAKDGADPVELHFDVQTLLENGWVEPSSQIILGLPLRFFYYVMMDISDSSISFTPQNLDSPVRALVNSAELMI